MKYESISHTVSAISVEDIIAGKHNYPWFLELLKDRQVFIGVSSIVVLAEGELTEVETQNHLVKRDDAVTVMSSREFYKTYQVLIGFSLGGFTG